MVAVGDQGARHASRSEQLGRRVAVVDDQDEAALHPCRDLRQPRLGRRPDLGQLAVRERHPDSVELPHERLAGGTSASTSVKLSPVHVT